MLRIKITPGIESDTCYRIKINNEVIDNGILFTDDAVLEYKGIFADPRESIDFVSIGCTNFFTGREIFIQEIQVNDVIVTAGENFGHKHIVSGCSRNIQQIMEGDYSDIVTMDRAGGVGDWIFIVLPNDNVAFWDKKLHFKNERLTFAYTPEERNMYSGEVNAKGKAHGHGTYIWEEGDKYVGAWKNSKMHGQGTNTYINGTQYVGEWKNSRMHGQGTYTWPDGKRYVGEFKKGVYDGQGTFKESDYTVDPTNQERLRRQAGLSASPDVIIIGDEYVGEWKDGKKHGIGLLNLTDGTVFAEEWKKDEIISKEPADAQKIKEIINELKKRNDSSKRKA